MDDLSDDPCADDLVSRLKALPDASLRALSIVIDILERGDYITVMHVAAPETVAERGMAIFADSRSATAKEMAFSPLDVQAGSRSNLH